MPANIENITINSALQIKNEVTPSDDHVLFVFKLDSNGKPVQGTQGFYSVEELIDTLGADATAAKKLAERYAKGTEGGVAVTSGEGYQDNARYYKDLCYQLSQAYDATALLNELTLMKKRGGGVAGKFILWAGTSATRPERTLICNGTELTIPTSSADTYWDLYKAIGTTWNTEDTPSGKFAIPDLITTADGQALGNFFRMAVTDSDVAKKQIDTIRNIIGRHEAYNDLDFIWPIDYKGTGAISDISGASIYRKSEIVQTEDGVSLGFSFSANDGKSTNPMAEHAAGNQIQPYNTAAMILIAY